MTESCMRASWKEFVWKIRRMERDMSQRDIWPTKILLIWKEEEKNRIRFLFFWIVPSLRLFIGQLDIFHMLHTCTEKEKNGSPVVSRKTLKEILNVTQAHTSHTQEEVRHTLLQSTQVSLPVDRVAASRVTAQCQFVSLCFLLLKRDLKIGQG